MTGDSLAKSCFSPPPVDFMKGLRRWLQTQLQIYPDDLGDILPHGMQNDSFNCAVIAINTIAHNVLGTCLWTPDTAVRERAEWFLKLAHTTPRPEHDIALSGKQNEAPDSIALPTTRQARITIADLLNSDESDSQITVDNSPIMMPVLPDAIPEPMDLETDDDHLAGVSDLHVDGQQKAPSIRLGKRLDRADSTDSIGTFDTGDSETDRENVEKKTIYKRPKAGEGKSKSAMWARKQRQDFKQGKLAVEPKKFQSWKEQILHDDRLAEFHPKDPRQIRHSVCGHFISVKQLYDLTRWRSHQQTCKAKGKAAGTKSLLSWFSGPGKRMANETSKQNKEYRSTYPCPGLSDQDDKRIPKFLRRTAALGGGGRSIIAIAEERFGRPFGQLDDEEKEEVWAVQQHGHVWRNDHQRLRVYSTTCKKQVPHSHGGGANYAGPCSACQTVLKLHAFKKALYKPLPQPKNMIYTNMRYRDRVKGELYGRHIGLKDIIETAVCTYLHVVSLHANLMVLTGCERDSRCEVCHRCLVWETRQ